MVSVVRELGALSISLRSLAKDEEELERLVNRDPGEALPETNPHRGDIHTWASEVRRLVGLRGGRDTKKVVNITRGIQVEEQRFEMGEIRCASCREGVLQ